MTDAYDERIVRFACVNTIAPTTVQPLVDVFAEGGLDLEVEYRDPPGPWAAVEWYLPTAAMLYLAKGYFDGFLKEAGREHYHVVKRAIGSLWSGFFGEQATVKVRIVTSAHSPKKTDLSEPFSLALSVIAQGDARNFKLLLRNDSSKSDLDIAVERFLIFMAEFHAGTLSPTHQDQLQALGTERGLIAVTYDHANDEIVVLDPRPPSVRGTRAP
jgi:hypothetical protein